MEKDTEDAGDKEKKSGKSGLDRKILLRTAEVAQGILEMVGKQEPRTPEMEAILARTVRIQLAILKQLLPKPRPLRVIRRKKVVRVVCGDSRLRS